VSDIVEVVDKWYELNQQRMELNHQADAIEEKELILKQIFMTRMRDQNILKIEATHCDVEIKKGEMAPTAKNWERIYEYIKEHNAFELLQRRLSAPAIREHWDAGEKIPGIDKYPIEKLSVTNKSPIDGGA